MKFVQNMKADQKKLLESAQHVSTILKQLSNPYRLMVLCCLADGELTVGDLNEQIDLSQSALSQHLAKLRESEIVATRRESQTIYYRIANQKISYLLDVLQTQFCEDI
jgi:ArsR family transcriptional regulator